MSDSLALEFQDILQHRENAFNTIETKEIQEKDRYDKTTGIEAVYFLEIAKIIGNQDVMSPKVDTNANEDNIKSEIKKWSQYVEHPTDIQKYQVKHTYIERKNYSQRFS